MPFTIAEKKILFKIISLYGFLLALTKTLLQLSVAA